MIARVTAAEKGIVKYLIEGQKNGRDFTRDQLDERVILDGDLLLTDKIINDFGKEGRDNYYHITLSFKEKDITKQEIENAYNQYKETLLTAYDKSEYNVFSEIHFPKIKNITDKKTKQQIERFPHVHMIIPKINLVTKKAFNPFGEYVKIIKYHDAIQEHVNIKFNLASPRDNRREFFSKATLISRIKGDNFQDKNIEIKLKVLEAINKKDIRTWNDFKKEASAQGEIKEYTFNGERCLKIKPSNKEAYVNLTEDCFNESYITKRSKTTLPKSNKEIQETVTNWVTQKAHEIKHVHSAGPAFRKLYHASPKPEKNKILLDRIEKYKEKNFPISLKNKSVINFNEYEYEYEKRQAPIDEFSNIKTGLPPTLPSIGINNEHLPKNRSPRSCEPCTSRDRREPITNKANSVSSMPRCNVVHATNGNLRAESILQNHENDNMEHTETNRDHFMRHDGRQAGRERINIDNVLNQLLSEHHQTTKEKEDLALFSEIRGNLKPAILFRNLTKFNIEPTDYQIFKAKDGSFRISTGNRNLNVSDFLTKHMNLNWEESREILLESYRDQIETKITSNKNSISLSRSVKVTDYTTKDSLRVFNVLKEREIAFDKLNQIKSGEFQEKETTRKQNHTKLKL